MPGKNLAKKLIVSSFIVIAVIFNLKSVAGQLIDSTSIKINPRFSFYSSEKGGEFIVQIPPSHIRNTLSIILEIDNSEICSWKGTPGKELLRLAFSINLPPADYQVTAKITSGKQAKYIAKTILTVLAPKENEVKTDRLTGGLIVNRRIFFPFGFYCYSPVYATLPEEEAVKGFNMMSPYQRILPETFNERKAYMDRCAQLGLKVHYNLLSVSGGGGVSSSIEGISDEEKKNRLIAEIEAFRDHPALLAWYISDEPTGNKISPSQLEYVYKIVKEADPWHPVSIVFMAPFQSSKQYANALDIVMADPYPIPNGPLTQVGNVAKQLRTEFNGKRPVWIVPQAFGGGEWWGREPSIQEMRSMTYQAIVNGATGIQYFVRHGPNSFPKSTATWDECGKIALEVAEITPWLLSDEVPNPVRSGSENITVSSALHEGRLLVIAVNTVNSPQKADIRITGSTGSSAKVLFENRKVALSSGILSDNIPAYGSQVYLIDTKLRKDPVSAFRGNLIKDPGFEDTSSPGVPASCYAWNEGDRGATFFLDSREHFEGNHSLRLITPRENKGSRLRFFPVSVSNGRTYIISIWAKTDKTIDNSAAINLNGNPLKPSVNTLNFEVGFGEFGKKRFCPGDEWQEFVTTVTIPPDNMFPSRTNVILRMPGAGTAWFDMLQVFEAVDINRSINPELLESW